MGGFTGSFCGAFLAIVGPPALTVLIADPSVPFLAVCLVLAILGASFQTQCLYAPFTLCVWEFSEKLPLFQKMPLPDWLIIGLVISSTCQSCKATVSEQFSSNGKEATLYPGQSS